MNSTQSKFGGASLYLNGSSYLTVTPNNGDLTLSSSNAWTFETWVYFPSLPSSGYALLSMSGLHIFIDGAGKVNVTNNSTANFVSTGPLVTTGGWHKVEVDVSATAALSVFIDGVAAGTGTLQSTAGTGTIYLGCRVGSDAFLVGYMDEIRISVGVTRHTAAYTPEASAFTISASPMTLQSVTLPINAPGLTSPSAMRALIQVDNTSATFTPNTDVLVYLSRDGGTTFTQGTLSLVQAMPDGTTVYDTGWLSVTGQPAGNSTMTYKVTTPTGKAIVLTGVSMQVKP